MYNPLEWYGMVKSKDDWGTGGWIGWRHVCRRRML